jgi:tetratricopeptide (TPR) repeat protein
MLMALGALLAVVSGCANRGEGAGWSWAEGRDAFDRGDYVTAEREWSRSLSAWEKGHPVDEDTAYFNEQLAKVQNALGKYPEAQAHAEKSIAIRTKLAGPQSELLAHPLYELARAVYYQGNYAEAAPIFERALPLIEKRANSRAGLLQFLEFYSSSLHKAGLATEAEQIDQRIKTLR